MAAHARKRRGGAAVELAVASIFLIPLIMYWVFVGEMFLMKLNNEEAATQAVWDYTVRDYQDPKGPSFDPQNVPLKGVSSFAANSRLTYCDHTAAYDSYDPSFECDDGKHHHSFTSHECWISGGADQIRCVLEDGNAARPSMPSSSAAVSSFQGGGRYSCSARLSVMNYYLPNKVMQQFANTDLTTKRKNKSRWAGRGGGGALTDVIVDGESAGENVHQDAETSQGGPTSQESQHFLMAKYSVSMLADPFALGYYERTATVAPPTTSGPLYSRIQQAYTASPLVFAGAGIGVAWHLSMLQDFLMPTTLADGSGVMGDDLLTPSVSFVQNSNEQGRSGAYSAGWEDNRSQQAHGNRGNHYFGFQQADRIK